MTFTTDMRKFGPKTTDHPSVGNECQACGVSFEAGDYTTLVLLGPGNDPEEQEKARSGRAYTAVATEIHWDCSSQRPETPDAILDWLKPLVDEFANEVLVNEILSALVVRRERQLQREKKQRAD